MSVKAVLVGSNPRMTIVRIAAIVGFSIGLFGFVLLPVRLQGISMLPTYRDGGLSVANRLAYWRRGPARGDVVTIRMAGPSVVYVKRVVALPGERVEIVAGVVAIDGKPLVEPFVLLRASWNMPPITLGHDEYFVAGDNRAMAMHDHEFGRAKRERIIAKLLF